MALGVLRALTDAGRRVPDDVSVVGFDDVPEAAYFAPALTTVRQDFEIVGTQAVTLLLRRMAGEPTAAKTTLGAPLTIRASTAAPPFH